MRPLRNGYPGREEHDRLFSPLLCRCCGWTFQFILGAGRDLKFRHDKYDILLERHRHAAHCTHGSVSKSVFSVDDIRSGRSAGSISVLRTYFRSYWYVGCYPAVSPVQWCQPMILVHPSSSPPPEQHTFVHLQIIFILIPVLCSLLEHKSVSYSIRLKALLAS